MLSVGLCLEMGGDAGLHFPMCEKVDHARETERSPRGLRNLLEGLRELVSQMRNTWLLSSYEHPLHFQLERTLKYNVLNTLDDSSPQGCFFKTVEQPTRGCLVCTGIDLHALTVVFILMYFCCSGFGP